MDERIVERRLGRIRPIRVNRLMRPGISGADALRVIKQKRPETKVVILTTFAISDVLSRALEEGADGALLKSTPNEELLDIIHRVAGGERYVSDEVKELIRSDPPLPPLSPRQSQMLEAVAIALRKHLLKI